MLDELVRKSPALVLVVVSWREDIVMQHSPLLALSCTANSGNIIVKQQVTRLQKVIYKTSAALKM